MATAFVLRWESIFRRNLGWGFCSIATHGYYNSGDIGALTKTNTRTVLREHCMIYHNKPSCHLLFLTTRWLIIFRHDAFPAARSSAYIGPSPLGFLSRWWTAGEDGQSSSSNAWYKASVGGTYYTYFVFHHIRSYV